MLKRLSWRAPLVAIRALPLILFRGAADAQRVAAELGRRIEVFTVKTAVELEQTFFEFAGRRIGGSAHVTDPFFNAEHRRLAALALQHRLPGVYPQREYVQAGGLLS